MVSTKLWVAAGTPHLPRAMRDVKEVVRELGADISVIECPDVLEYSEDKWFDKRAPKQLHAKYSWAWKLREGILMRTPFALYDFITG